MGLAEQLRTTYKQAGKEVQKKMDSFWARHKAKAERMLKDVEAGKISAEEYQRWLRGQVFIGERWKEKLDDITQVYVDADEKARRIIGGTSKNEFIRCANQQAKDVEKKVGGGISFDVYDKHTVERLLRKDPKMLPEWKINEPKDYKWNEQRVRNQITQGIIQGEAIDDIAKRLTKDLSAGNARQMTLFARTAVTGAQNAGRIDMLHHAQDMGIVVKKKWLAAHDSRVRESHAFLDGQTVEVDEPFVTENGNEIMFPGDPSAPPEEVYNCRCTLTYVYEMPKQIEQQEEREATQEEQKQTFTPATNRKEAQELLLKTGFKEVGQGVKYIDEQTFVASTNQIASLNQKFGVIKDGYTGSFTTTNSREYDAAARGSFYRPQDTTLELSLNTYTHSHDAIAKRIEGEISRNWAMPCSSEYYDVYTITHEYGHMLENVLMNQRIDIEAYEREIKESTKGGITLKEVERDLKRRREIGKKYETEAAKSIFQEILQIAREIDPDFKLSANISDYGKKNYLEAFAETFANSQLGKPNTLGKAMNKWLEGKF